MIIRIKFEKKGPVKFIGHLDIMRYFQKAVRRSGLDVRYSNGFSPHQLMSFAAPLGVGLESNGEYMDLEMNSITTGADMLKRLNDCMTTGIRVLSVKLLEDTAGNAMASVGAASYTVRFRNSCNVSFSLEDAVARLLSQDQIMIHKQTKRSETDIDIKPSIFSLTASDSAVPDTEDGTDAVSKNNAEDGSIRGKEVRMCVDASSAGNIKPAYVIEALFALAGKTLGEFDLMITREDTLFGADRDFAPLDSIANEF